MLISRTIVLIAISVFLFLPLAGAQTTTTQSIKVWSSKSTYAVGDTAQIFWDKNNPCLLTAGAQGKVTASGPGLQYPGLVGSETLPIDLQGGITSGTYKYGSPFDSTNIGTWRSTVTVTGQNCQVFGQVTFQVSATPVPEFPSSSVVVVVVLLASVALIGQHRRLRR